MCKTKKIIAGALCAIVAGIGIIAIGNEANVARAQTQTAGSAGVTATTAPTPAMSIAQLQQIIDLLRQQIQQILVLLQQRIPRSPICDNGICETAKGETATNCPQDCGVATACIKEGGSSGVFPMATPCCPGLTKIGCDSPDTNGNCQYGCGGGSYCTKCGNGVCGLGENKCNCPVDCDTTSARCTDSDGGINYYVKGTATQYVPAGGAGAISNQETDTCYNYNPDLFDSASASASASVSSASSGYWLREAYCNGNVLGHKTFQCEYGCQDGACVNRTTACAKEGETFTDDNRQCCAGMVKKNIGTPCGGADICIQVIHYTCVKPTTACANEGETFTDPNRQCCAGLVRQSLEVDCGSGMDCVVGYPTRYVCAKPVALKSCAEVCRGQGYANSQCNTYAISPEGMKNMCPVGYVISNQSASDCQIRRNADGIPVVGAGAACCCGNDLTAKCLQEGQIGSGGPQLSTTTRQECCPGLKAWPLPNAADAPFLCTAKCGNGVCDSSLEKTYCPQDCVGICARRLSGSPTAAEKTQCANAGGTIYCGNGWCQCACDAPKPACSSSLSADQCKIAGGAYLCPENYSTTSVYLGSGSSSAYYKSSCYCSCPSTIGGSQTTTSSVNLGTGSSSSIYLGGGN